MGIGIDPSTDFSRIYVHIPFCRKKCDYCAFFSQEPSRDDLEHYVRRLQDEMSIRSTTTTAHSKLDSIYFGGGTPSLLEPQQVGELLELAANLFGLSPSAEITLEANPGTVDLGTLTAYRQTGVNRLSIGVQSFDDRMLATLGRIHTSRQAKEAFAAARKAGFDNIGIDLIHSLPDQTADMWRLELEQAIELAPEHLSVYGLTIEEETPFANRYPENCPHLPDQDLSAEMFETADDLLTSHGYEHYEIANYAKPGRHSRHNSGYWRRDGYLGLGAAAHSFLRDSGFGMRCSNVSDLKAYYTALENGMLACDDTMSLTCEDAMAECLFLGLRMAEGVSFAFFRNSFGRELKDEYGRQIRELISKGLLVEDTAGIRLTRRGMLLSNQVFQEFLT
jgi:oxygen-independent coproporphyrinogen-3 oxidase